MSPISVKSLVQQNGYFVLQNVDQITHAESLTPGPGGANNFNWILGHIAYWRNEVLKMAGVEPVWSDGAGAPYRGSPEKRMPLSFNADQAMEIDELASDFREMQERLEAWTARNGDGDQPDHLVNLLLHEAYHAGQLGVLRRALGKEGAI